MKSAMKSASESTLDSWNLKASEDLSEDTWSSIDGSGYGSDFEAWGLDESSWFDLRGRVGGGQAAAKRQKFEQSVLSTLKKTFKACLMHRARLSKLVEAWFLCPQGPPAVKIRQGVTCSFALFRYRVSRIQL